MLQQATTIDTRLLVRMCVACGYNGKLLRNGTAPRCARCGCDLRKRPARSYAEMEGLIHQTITLDSPSINHQCSQRYFNKWILFLFFAAIGIFAMIQLTAATFSI